MTCQYENCTREKWAKGFCSAHYYTAQRQGLLPRPPCSVEECGEPAFRKGMCNKHHLRTQRHGDPHFRKKAANGERAGKICEVEGCGQPVQARTLCSVHHGRLRHHGDPLAEPRKLANGSSTDERRKAVARQAFLRYQKTPHGKVRGRFNSAKRRILAGAKTSRHIPKEEFLKLWNTDVCGICGGHVADEDKSLDHIRPLSKGGDNTLDNLQIAHLLCNQRKSDRAA